MSNFIVRPHQIVTKFGPALHALARVQHFGRSRPVFIRCRITGVRSCDT